MFLGTHAAHAPDRPAIIMAGSSRVLTYGELDDSSKRLASSLHHLGLRRGDVIALLTDNAPEAFEVYWAAIRSGLYITLVNRHLAPEEIAYILHDSEAKILFASAGVAELAQHLVGLIPDVWQCYSFGGSVTGFLPYDHLLALTTTPLPDQPCGAELLYSSGTTGRPKGIKPPLPTRQVDEPGDSLVELLQQVLHVTSDDVYLSPAPVYHAAPLKWCAVMHAIGGCVVMMERFDAEVALEAIQRYEVSITQMVPTMFVRLLQLPEAVRERYDTSSLRLVVHAGAPCPPDVKEAMIDWWGPILLEYYGATERHGMTMINTQQWQSKRGSVGQSVQGVLHICDDAGGELPQGQTGIIYFEQDSPAFIYHNDPEKTAAARHPDHETWSTVGDIGYVDSDGFLFITDRKAFTIISGGVNIYPQEIENVLALHPQILDVAVIGVPDSEMGQQVKAVVQLRKGTEPSDDLGSEIISYVRDRLAHFKAPRTVEFVEELPRLETGKLAKGQLIERFSVAQ
ncbi:acyl-CoA synthetase [Mycolicibacterium novocastrense]|uniref:acyl-CoA synthetase n=1 Tax=Mycolicibacterium novocastrense TaxID=59813 RepID=UPI00157AF870|nr:acyl-CoA synthetase [Mycolicibacterium novocastrense]